MSDLDSVSRRAAPVDSKTIDAIRGKFPDLALIFDMPWSKLSTLGVGGSVPLVAEPADDMTLMAFLKFCDAEGIKILPLGAGSNMVGSDAPVDSVVVRLRQNDFVKVRSSHVHVTAGAGIRLHDFLVECARHGLGGFAPLAGIPGRLGGALRMNAGRGGVVIGEMAEDLTGVTLQGEPWCCRGKDVQWGYRQSSIPADVIVTAAICKLKPSSEAVEMAAIAAIMEQARARYPKERNTGCVFKNPVQGEPAGKLIDSCGGRGLSVGFAAVSHEHCNIIVNRGGATEADFLELAVKLKHLVWQRTGVVLEAEVCFANPASAARLAETPS